MSIGKATLPWMPSSAELNSRLCQCSRIYLLVEDQVHTFRDHEVLKEYVRTLELLYAGNIYVKDARTKINEKLDRIISQLKKKIE